MDAQSIIDCMGGGNGGVPVVAREYHQGLCRSVQGTFKVMATAVTMMVVVVPCHTRPIHAVRTSDGREDVCSAAKNSAMTDDDETDPK